MSQWAYVRGFVKVHPMGRTQAEMRYILDTVLDHLPRVTGSEGDMDVYVVQEAGHNVSCSHDEFGERTDKLTDFNGVKGRHGWVEMQDNYILVVDGSLRDRSFAETKRAFLKWLCRLAKRVMVREALVSLDSYDGSMLIHDDMDRFWNMFEDPSWSHEDPLECPPNWCEYLMWDKAKGWDLPLELVVKYYNDPESDAEFEQRQKYDRYGKRW